MRLSLVGLGVFPNPRRPQVIWAGLAGDLEPLQGLQAAVEARAAALGFAPEARAYQPHLTLGRVKGALAPAELMRLLEHLKAHSTDGFGDFEADALSLVRSDLQPAGSVYTTLYAAPLGSARVSSEEQC
jgi:2'-5' RNA ligase